MAHRLAPRFLASAAGRIHLSEWIPEPAGPGAPVVIVFPPFAEEMNRARRMFACMARDLAALGIGTVVFDPYGTGDSDGDFADADWNAWLQDARAVTRDVRSRASSVGVLALRSGALLAMETFREASEPFAHAVFWAPVPDGRAVVRQLLRLHAAAFMSTGQGAEATRSAEAELAAGGTVEIAGYSIRASLVRALERLHLREVATARPPSIDWIELVPGPDQEAPPGSARLAAQLAASGVAVRLAPVHDEPFWSLPEITVAPRLASLTATLFASSLRPRGH